MNDVLRFWPKYSFCSHLLSLCTIVPFHGEHCIFGVASRRKLKTWVYLRHRLARSCVHLRWLAMTYAHLDRDQICTQIKASFSPFGHPTSTQPKSTQIEWHPLTCYKPMKYRVCLPWNDFFLRLACTCEETCECVWPPNANQGFSQWNRK